MATNIGGKRYIGLLVVLVLALLSWWFQRQESVQVTGAPRDAHVVDYAIRDFEMMAMDDNGRPLHRMRAVSMVHYADDNSAEVQQPQLLIYRTVGEHWQLEAEQALLHQDGNEILLQGRVQMRRLDAAEQVTLELVTRDLMIHNDQQRAETAAAVEIRESHGITRAQGLKIDLKAGRMELLSAVRGEYVRER